MTELEAHDAIKVLAALWPQMADDLADNEEYRKVWLGSLRKVPFSGCVDALRAYRQTQTKPIRPEPGAIKSLIRQYASFDPLPGLYVIVCGGDREEWKRLWKMGRAVVPWAQIATTEEKQHAETWCREQSMRSNLQWKPFVGTQEAAYRWARQCIIGPAAPERTRIAQDRRIGDKKHQPEEKSQETLF